MSKKWLYSVALGALLMAGDAFGITVHEVLSNGFWSAEQRGTFEYAKKATDGYRSFTRKKEKEFFIDDAGIGHYSFMDVYSAPKISGMRWKTKRWYNWKIDNEGSYTQLDLLKSSFVRQNHKEKTTTDLQEVGRLVNNIYEFTTQHEETVYMNKPKKKEARPIGPYVVDDWFPGAMESRSWRKTQFYGTEHTAVTNIISDNEAYITGNISQTGHIDEYDGYIVNEDTSLLRTYTQHITTDADHVYVEQEITEDAKNALMSNRQNTYQTQYTATFKKGRWKGETETITVTQNSQITDWFLKYWGQNTR